MSAAVIALTAQVGVWVVYAVANHYGYGERVQDIVQIITKIAEAILPVLPPMLVSAAATKGAYDRLSVRNVPGFRQKVG